MKFPKEKPCSIFFKTSLKSRFMRCNIYVRLVLVKISTRSLPQIIILWDLYFINDDSFPILVDIV